MNRMKVIVAPGFMPLAQELHQLPRLFGQQGQLLYDGRNRVKAITLAGTPVVVKRFKRPNIIQRVVYTFFKKSKAERAYRYAAMMRQRGVLTPQEVAYVEISRHGLLADCSFVSLPCHLPPLSSLLRRADFDRGVARQLGVAVARWHEVGVLHGDLNLTNILYEQDHRGHCRFWLIDTNRSTFDHATYLSCVNNIMRLSHDRPLLQYVVAAYAETRGWDTEKTVADVMKCLEYFEQHKHRVGVVKRCFKTLMGKNQ